MYICFPLVFICLFACLASYQLFMGYLMRKFYFLGSISNLFKHKCIASNFLLLWKCITGMSDIKYIFISNVFIMFSPEFGGVTFFFHSWHSNMCYSLTSPRLRVDFRTIVILWCGHAHQKLSSWEHVAGWVYWNTQNAPYCVFNAQPNFTQSLLIL